MAEPEGFFPVNPTKIVDTALALLKRQAVISRTFWRNAGGDFRGVPNETISIRVPAYVEANRRALRSDDNRVQSTLYERKVDVTLTHDLQVDVPLTDEEITLDIRALTRDVIAPSTEAIARAYEQECANLMQNATYEIELDWDDQDPWTTLVDARTALNDLQVPQAGRYLVVGSGYENELLKSDRISKADQAGDSQALRNASLGSLAGFSNILVSHFLAPEEAYAYHMTAYALNTMAPFVPQGTAWGASAASDGFAIRVMQHISPAANGSPINIVYHDAWVGSNTVGDHGEINADGKFIPSVEPDLDDNTDLLFVRAVKIGGSGS